MNYLRDYHAQRRTLSRLCRELGIPMTEQGPGRKVPRHNNVLRVALHDVCLGPEWGECTDGKNAAEFDRMLACMVDTLNMENSFNLAVAQACIRAGKIQAKLGWSEMAVLRDAKGRTVVRPMTHKHRMARMQAASEVYAEARRYQKLHEEGVMIPRAAEHKPDPAPEPKTLGGRY